MVSAEVARNIVGVIGNIISFFLFLSPVPTCKTIWHKKSVEEFKPDPYIASMMNCMLWIFYGLPVVHPDSTLVVTINSVGLALEIIYLSIFFFYGLNKHRLKITGFIVVELIALAIIAAITLFVFHTHTKRSNFVGVLCVVFIAIMYASPLTVMWKVIKTKSVQYMPYPLSLTTFLNGCIWTAYALIKFDRYILIGNGLGALFGAMQLILYAFYFNSTPKYEEGRKPSKVQLYFKSPPKDEERTKPSEVQLSRACDSISFPSLITPPMH